MECDIINYIFIFGNYSFITINEVMGLFKNRAYVLEVYKAQSFSAAAKNLYISQPSLSASIKRIEDKACAPLFNRATSPITLTDIGEEYVRCAHEMDKIEDGFQSFVHDSLNLIRGEVKIGGSSLFSSYIMPPVISTFNAKYPNIELTIYEGGSKHLLSLLLDGELDIVLDNNLIVNENVYSQVYMPETLLLAVPKNLYYDARCALTVGDVKNGRHCEADAPCAELEDFSALPFIFLKQENDTGKRAMQLCKKHGFTPNVLFALDQQVTAYNITCTGMGASFVSDTLIQHLHEVPNVFYYKLSDEEIYRDLYFYLKNHRYMSTACRTFIDSALQ